MTWSWFNFACGFAVGFIVCGGWVCWLADRWGKGR